MSIVQSNQSPCSPPSGYTINELVCFDPILNDYFTKNAVTERYWNLAHDLMLDGIRYRTEQGDKGLYQNQQVAQHQHPQQQVNAQGQQFAEQIDHRESFPDYGSPDVQAGRKNEI